MYTIHIPSFPEGEEPLRLKLSSYSQVTQPFINAVKRTVLNMRFGTNDLEHRRISFAYLRTLNKKHFQVMKEEEGITKCVFDGTAQGAQLTSTEPVHVITKPRAEDFSLQEKTLEELLEIQKQVMTYSQLLSEKIADALFSERSIQNLLTQELSNFTA